jgi:hypothetical protein
LEFEQLEESHPFARRCRNLQSAGWIGEHETGLGQVKEVHAAAGEQGQVLEHIEVADQGVSDVDERLGQECLSHRCLLRQPARSPASHLHPAPASRFAGVS